MEVFFCPFFSFFYQVLQPYFQYICLVKLFSLFCLLLFCANLGAQEIKADDTDSLNIQYRSADGSWNDYNYYSLDGFTQYRSAFFDQPFAYSGNLGLPTHSFAATGFNLHKTESILGAFNSFAILEEDIRYYSTLRPFTSLDYYNGAKSEQYFTALHTQNLGPGMNLSFQYDRVSSEGYFSDQLTNHTRFTANYHLHSRNQRFKSQAFFRINNLEAQENGGVFVSDDQSNQPSNTILLDVAMRGAQNINRSQQVNVKNSYALISTSDSSGKKPLIALGHQLNWSRAYRVYKDVVASSADIYTNTFLDSTNSHDSSFAQVWANRIFLEGWDGLVQLGFEKRSFHYQQNFINGSDFDSDLLVASFADSLGDFYLQGGLEKGMTGYYEEELLLNASLAYSINKASSLAFHFLLDNAKANPLLQKQRSNRYYWDKNLDLQSRRSFEVNYSHDVWKLKINVVSQQISNLLYYNRDGQLLNYKERIQTNKIDVSKGFKFLRNFHFTHGINYQTVSEDTILPLPNFWSRHSLFYENKFFEKALLLQVGIDAFVIGPYRGYRYNPSLADMQLRSNNKDLGGINQIDLFLAIRIRRSARIFIRMENLLQSPYEEASARIQDYPVPGRVIKWGVSWRMIN